MSVNATANQAASNTAVDPKEAIKVASPSLLQLNNKPLPIEAMIEIGFQDIGGHELINISRSDAINGQDIIYSIVKNLKNILLEYNSNNIIRLQGTSDNYFKNFSIRLEQKLPKDGTGPNKEIVYIEESTGNLVVNLVNLEKGEQVEIEIINQGETFDDTIKASEV
jgi:hypothetical protein